MWTQHCQETWQFYSKQAHPRRRHLYWHQTKLLQLAIPWASSARSTLAILMILPTSTPTGHWRHNTRVPQISRATCKKCKTICSLVRGSVFSCSQRRHCQTSSQTTAQASSSFIFRWSLWLQLFLEVRLCPNLMKFSSQTPLILMTSSRFASQSTSSEYKES